MPKAPNMLRGYKEVPVGEKIKKDDIIYNYGSNYWMPVPADMVGRERTAVTSVARKIDFNPDYTQDDMITDMAEAIAQFYGAKIEKERGEGIPYSAEDFKELLETMIDVAGLDSEYFICDVNED